MNSSARAAYYTGMKTLLWLLAGALTLAAQRPAFEVASVKVNRTGSPVSSMRPSPGKVTIENASLQKITLLAYGIPDDREYALVGPDWLATERFDIQATFPVATPIPQALLMLQTLLADRFKLTLHRDSKEVSGYALTLTKTGSKLRATAENIPPRTSLGPGKLEATGTTPQKLSDLLAKISGRPVSNETGLPGRFDFTLEWSPDETLKMRSPEDIADAAATGPSLFTAVQEQLGLKLESRKVKVEILVVDHMERTPTEN
ncbi:MAG: TIGR03435 family protein [Acidobacteriota bacterium]|nr:TIGR03435 family protein [Acidobacteriota bacterium]